jgi:membrane protease YdiL (CAAX protease family)
MPEPSITAVVRSPDDELAARLRGFGPIGLLAIVVVLAGNGIVPPLSAVLALVWVHWSRTPWREIGYVRPSNWTRTIVVGIAFGVVLKFALKAIVMPMLGADPVNQAYRHLTGNTAAMPMMIFAVTIGAGFGEETVFRGYLFERLGKLFGSGAPAKVAIVMFTSAVFGLVHYPDQGLAGVQQATVVGLTLGIVYAMTGRLFMLMIAHAAFDLTALVMIYWGFEEAVARWIF